MRIVVDHFGWPENPSEEELPRHRERLAAIAAASNTATRIDAIGTIFGNGEKTSNTGQTYSDYHGSFYDKAFPPKK